MDQRAYSTTSAQIATPAPSRETLTTVLGTAADVLVTNVKLLDEIAARMGLPGSPDKDGVASSVGIGGVALNLRNLAFAVNQRLNALLELV